MNTTTDTDRNRNQESATMNTNPNPNTTTEDFAGYARNFDEGKFKRLLPRLLARAGRSVVLKALYLYQALISSHTPAHLKALILGALGYLVLPFDLIPDFIVPLGFVDDAAALAACLVAVRQALTPAVRQRAEAAANRLFGG